MDKQLDTSTAGQQRIEAVLKDGTQCLLAPRVLDVMLDRNLVSQFKRSYGWVAVGIVPIRARRRRDVDGIYDGPERRGSAYV